jgi:hypothetical protein
LVIMSASFHRNKAIHLVLPLHICHLILSYGNPSGKDHARSDMQSASPLKNSPDRMCMCMLAIL